MVGVALGEQVLELSGAILAHGPLGTDEKQALSAALGADSMEDWKRALAREAGLAYSWTHEIEKMGGVERFAVRLQEPHTIAASLGIYLGMHEAVRDRVPDVGAHIYAVYDEAATATWLNPVAQMLIPNLVSVAEKRRDYHQDLDAMRSRLEDLSA